MVRDGRVVDLAAGGLADVEIMRAKNDGMYTFENTGPLAFLYWAGMELKPAILG